MTLVIAHAGHWLPQLLYLAPLIVLVVAIVLGRLRERREGRESEHEDI
jgi:cytochrome c oxidase assembly factor CtaG